MYPTSLVTDTIMCTIIIGVSVECIELVTIISITWVLEMFKYTCSKCIHHALTCIGSKYYVEQLVAVIFWFWHLQKTLSSPAEGPKLGLDFHSYCTTQQSGLYTPRGWHQSSSGCLAVSSGPPTNMCRMQWNGRMMELDHVMHMTITILHPCAPSGMTLY